MRASVNFTSQEGYHIRSITLVGYEFTSTLQLTLKRSITNLMIIKQDGSTKINDHFKNLMMNNRDIKLDDPILDFDQDNPRDFVVARDFLRGCGIFGGTGSGKTSSSGRAIAMEFLKYGMGGLVLCAKPEERYHWEWLAKKCSREKDLIIFDEKSKYRFNPFQYEVTRKGKGAGATFNLVNLLMILYQMGRTITGQGAAHDGERFWDTALKRLVGRVIELLKLACEKVSISNMHAVITSTLTREERAAMDDLMEKNDETVIMKKLEKWGEENFYIRCLCNATKHLIKEEGSKGYNSLVRQYHLVKNYFNREFALLAERTKTIIVESFLGVVEPFLGGILYEYFANETNIYPEWIEEGKIIIIDFPIKEYMELGVYAQGIFKYLTQQALERRKFKEGDMPAFLWIDEAHFFLNSEYDQLFLTTSRSSGTCVCLITQNISNFYAAIGGRNPKPKVDSLLGLLAVKIFHNNSDPVTNNFAAESIGKYFKSVGGISAGQYNNINLNQQLHYQVDPREFTVLKTGGQLNDFEAEAIITVAGKVWSNDKNFIKTKFSQK